MKQTQARNKAAIINKYKSYHQNFIEVRSDSELDLYETMDEDSSNVNVSMGKYRQKFAKVSFDLFLLFHSQKNIFSIIINMTTRYINN